VISQLEFPLREPKLPSVRRKRSSAIAPHRPLSDATLSGTGGWTPAVRWDAFERPGSADIVEKVGQNFSVEILQSDQQREQQYLFNNIGSLESLLFKLAQICLAVTFSTISADSGRSRDAER
jgi:hypothetical protein